ncbi:MAG: ABC-F family ATP-binding cassette domain-containing protein [Defluviitaleaceae bacterium]|nr:ABC-F family ATP-binding cassette domain-containing protein [Defluviitaleaceae bacterium]
MISLKNISKSFGENTIISDVTFHMHDNEKVALVGVNGAGKTTLFRVLTKEYEPDGGEIIIPPSLNLGYLPQSAVIDSDKTIYEEMLSVFDEVIKVEESLRLMERQMAGLSGSDLEVLMKKYADLQHNFEKKDGYEYSSRVKGVIKGLGFSDEESKKNVQVLSGGEKTRVALGKLLLSKADVLLLDEPTNHLDITSTVWLEDFLKNYPGGMIIISHDRYFLDKVVGKVIEMEHGKATIYHGNYSHFASKKEEVRENQLKQYFDQQKEIKRQEEIIARYRSYSTEKQIKRAKSKEKMLDKVERLEKPDSLPQSMRLKLSPQRESGNDVLSVRNICKSFPDKQLFSGVSFEIKKGDRVALIGANGTGKTTIIRAVLGNAEINSGDIKLGTNVFVSYYDQEHQNIDSQKTLFDEISDAYPKLTSLEIRNALAAFVFIGDDVFKKIGMLSGGEQGRLSLAKIIQSGGNFLILDEPTNHLDIYSKEILEQALKNYTGTILYISHDRYFINSTATKILELADGEIKEYLGNYDYYVEKKSNISDSSPIYVEETVTTAKMDWQANKQKASEERKIENRVKKIEEQIEALEREIEAINSKLNEPEINTDHAKAAEFFEKLTSLEQDISGLYEEWEVYH